MTLRRLPTPISPTAPPRPGRNCHHHRLGAIQNWDLTTGNQVELGSKLDFLEGRGNATLAAYRIVRKNL